MRKLKRTYKNWLEGKVCPSPSFIKNGFSEVNCKFQWEDFTEEDLKVIRIKQKEIFEALVLKILNEYILKFNADYEKSEVKEQLLFNTIMKWEEVLFYLRPTFAPKVEAIQSDLVFEKNHYIEIRRYIKFVYEEGGDIDYSFIHSECCQFYEGELYAQIEAEAYYRFWKMLKEMNHIETKEIDTVDKELKHNPRPDIFKNYYAFKMFEELVKTTVVYKSRTADYAFIFHKMINPKIGLIIPTVTHPYFINFLNEMYTAEIKSRKLPFVNPTRKRRLFEKALEDYNNLIQNEIK